MDILEMIQKNDMLKVILILVAVYFFMKYYKYTYGIAILKRTIL